MENKQTAVEWFVSQIAGAPTHYIIDGESVEVKEDRYNLLFNLDIDITPLVEQAKAMEIKQIREAYYKGVRDEWEAAGRDFENYYNEKYANDTTEGLPKENSKRRGWHY